MSDKNGMSAFFNMSTYTPHLKFCFINIDPLIHLMGVTNQIECLSKFIEQIISRQTFPGLEGSEDFPLYPLFEMLLARMRRLL